MADTVTTQVLNNGGRHYTVVLTNVSDGTGESAVAKVTKSSLVDAHGNVPTILRIVDVVWNIQGFGYIKLAFDHTTDDTALVLTGSGALSFESVGGLPDPNSAGGTGNVVLTAPSGATTGSYTIVLNLTK